MRTRPMMLTLFFLLIARLLSAQTIGGVTALTTAPTSLTTQFSTTCTSVSCATLYTGGYANIAIQVTGTWTGTVTFKASVDGVNFQAVTLTPFVTASAVSTATANGAWQGTVVAQVVRVEFTTKSSGTAVVSLRATVQ